MPKPVEFRLSDDSQAILDHTLDKMMPLWMDNFGENFTRIREGKNASNLIKPYNKPAIIVGAGPSIEKYGHLDTLSKHYWNGLILSTDKMLKPCIQHGIEPDFVCTVDGTDKIAPFYEDIPEVKTKFLLCATTTHPEVVKSILGTQKDTEEVYWFISLLDNPFSSTLSLTRAIHHLTKGKFILQTPGQVGTTLWNVALCLSCNPIILIGFDFSYTDFNPETSIYYPFFIDICKGDKQEVKKFYKYGKNPRFKNQYLTDGVWLMYKEIFMMLINSAPIETVNCTEGGALWGGKIRNMKLVEAMDKYV